jgi:hypothetical protein
MVNEEIVRNTIQKMRDAGLSDGIISSTLSDLGLTPSQVQGYLSGNTNARTVTVNTSANYTPQGSSARNAPSNSSGSVNAMDHEELASRTSEKILSRLDERNALDDEEEDLKDNITHLAMEQHGTQLQETHQAVMELHDKFDSTALDTLSNRVSNMNARMEQLSKDVVDTKALAMALQSLLQKILETNQQLLFEMKSKK